MADWTALGVLEEDLPPALVDLVQRRAEGNPFFAEELLLNLQAHDVLVVKADPDTGKAESIERVQVSEGEAL